MQRKTTSRTPVFAKKRGLSVLDMAKSNWVYKKLRNFRAGIERGISTLNGPSVLTEQPGRDGKGLHGMS